MKRLLLVVALAGLMSGMIGCDDDGAKIVTGQTNINNRTAMDFTGGPTKLQKEGIIDDHRTVNRPDGVAIDAWAIKAKTPPAKGTMVLLHGLGESKANYLTMGRNLAAKGYDVVLIDLRCHGWSTGKHITCGAKEKEDVKAVIDALVAAGVVKADPLYVAGVSFGGATAIQYAAIDPRVKGLLVVAPWKDTASKAKRDLPLASQKDLDAALADAAELADFDPQTTSALVDIQTFNGPVFLIHGLLDLSGVPLEDSKALYAAAKGPKRLHVISPGPEQLTLMLAWEQWLADRADEMAQGTMRTGETTLISTPADAKKK